MADGAGPGRLPRAAIAVSTFLVLAAVVLVGLSLRREPPEGFPVTLLEPTEVGDRRVAARVTLDASDPARWTYFDFSRGATVTAPGATDWDLAFRRFEVAANGGRGFAGTAALLDLGQVAFDSVRTLPASGYLTADARRDSAHPALERWYDYSFTSHLLTPKPRVYALRTADGRYAKLRFLSYYCPGATPGCITVEYVYQGDGTRVVE